MRGFGRFLLLLSSLSLCACGRGGGGSGTPAGDNPEGGISTGTVTVGVTDTFATDYSKAWVRVKRVAAQSGSGKEHLLFENNEGRLYNILELAGVVSLLASTELPAGSYPSIHLTLDNRISLVDLDDQTIEMRFPGTGSEHSVKIDGPLDVEAGRVTLFAIDFDAGSFATEPSQNLVDPVVTFRSRDELGPVASALQSKVEGMVAGVLDSQRFLLVLEHGGATVTVTLHATAVVYDEGTGATAVDTSLLKAGQKVEVAGSFDSGAQSLTGLSVRVEGESASPGPRLASAEGFVLNVSGSTLTLDVREAKGFVPPTSQIVVEFAGAVFTRGSLGSLAVGQKVEAKGSWDGAAFSASLLEIEGFAPGGDDGNSAGDYSEVYGFVQQTDGDSVIVQVTKTEHFAPGASEVEVNITAAFFKKGSRTALVVGSFIEAKGTWDGQTFDATVVEIKAGSAGGGSGGTSQQAELQGLIQNVSGALVTVSITKVEHFFPPAATVAIDVSRASYKHGVPADLLTGRLIEAKGLWDGQVLMATQIEFEK